MSELNDHIKHIAAKLQQLLKRHEVLQKENTAFRHDIEALRKENEQFRQQVEELKINAYLHNIDKCISLLGK